MGTEGDEENEGNCRSCSWIESQDGRRIWCVSLMTIQSLHRLGRRSGFAENVAEKVRGDAGAWNRCVGSSNPVRDPERHASVGRPEGAGPMRVRRDLRGEWMWDECELPC